MTTLNEAAYIEPQKGVFSSLVMALVRTLLLVFCCLTPLTAIIAHGWLTRKLEQDILARLQNEQKRPWPNIIFADNRTQGGPLHRFTGGLYANIKAGVKAFLAILQITLPVTLIWLGGWVAGWENSFNKGYENAGIWPLTSLLAVFLAVPVFIAAPMAIAHQAHKGTISAILKVREVTKLIRAAGFSYLWPTLLIAIGSIGILGARALPVFAEQIAPGIAAEKEGAIDDFAARFQILTTLILFIGLIIVRGALARNYATAVARINRGYQAGKLKLFIVAVIATILWLGMIFLVYTAQFMNYNWWHWLNQPILMLPWLGRL